MQTSAIVIARTELGRRMLREQLLRFGLSVVGLGSDIQDRSMDRAFLIRLQDRGREPRPGLHGSSATGYDRATYPDSLYLRIDAEHDPIKLVEFLSQYQRLRENH